MAQQIQTYSISAPGFFGLNTQDSSLDLAAGFARVANNVVIDQYGRIGSRKGWTKINSSSITNDVKSIGELINDAGTVYTICAAGNKLYSLSGSTLTELTYGGGGSAPTISDDNWQMAMLGGILSLYQTGHDPLAFAPAVSTTTYRRVSELTGYAGTVQQSDCVISAYGRIWNANTASDKVTVQWSNVSTSANFSTGTSGTLNTTTVWPRGADTIVALGAHNGFLFIFGKENILIYSGATTPASMTLYDVVTGIGCISRDSVAYTGTDIIFLSQTGVRSVLRTIQEKSSPLRELSKNVRNDLLSAVNSETLSNIKSVYSPLEAFYLLTLPLLKKVYCFDTKAQLQDGSARVTTWTYIQSGDKAPTALLSKRDGTLLMGKTGYIATYSNYTDNAQKYTFSYYTNHTDLGTPGAISILKKLSVVLIGGSDQYVTMKWGYDFAESYYSQAVKIPTQGVSYYGVGEYGIAKYSGGIALQTLKTYPTGSGKIVQTGYESDINGFSLSIQKIEIQAKQGKIV